VIGSDGKQRPQIRCFLLPLACFWFVMVHRLVAFVAELACRAYGLGGLGLVVLVATGCQTPLTVRGQSNPIAAHPQAQPGVTPWVASVPTEKDKSTLPTYVIEPPDILLIDAVKLVPKAPYHVEPLDVLQIMVANPLIDQPISGQYPIDPSGAIDLGPAYGKVLVTGQTVDEARHTIETHLRTILRDPQVAVSLSQTSGQQQVADQHLVGPDGTVNLGTYGTVYVAGMTIAEAKTAVEAQLSNYLEQPRVSVDVFAYNSQVYYVITEGAGLGDTVVRIPITGNETVLDALAQVNGLSRLSSKNIWIARPTPGDVNCDQILPVSWTEITKGAATATNYQLMPGDRLFIAENKIIALDTFLDQVSAPVERLFGTTLLGAQAIQTINRFPKGLGSGGGF
jgi:polysaccharide biosynthesis/export protein